MGCIYINFDGECTMHDEDGNSDMMGCDKEGNCICEDDPHPENTCESYESDGGGDDEE